MYKLLIIFRYFQRKMVAIFALLAVTLCTAMMIIVISVMGGFLDLLTHTAKSLSGDVVVQRDATGFPHYEQILTGLRKLPQVSGAAALVRGFGLIKIHGEVRGVHIVGVRPEAFNSVTNFRTSLHWTSQHYMDYLDSMLDLVGSTEDQAVRRRRAWYESNEMVDLSMQFKGPRGDASLPGMVPGIAVSPLNRRDDKGQYQLWRGSTGTTAVLTVIPINTEGGMSTPTVEWFNVVNEFKSGFMELDFHFIYLPFHILQRMLEMDAVKESDEEGNETGGMIPSRATQIMVRGAAGYSLAQVEDAVQQFIDQFVANESIDAIYVNNWLEGRFGTILAAVRKEKFMMAFLIGVICSVAVVLVGLIFYMIVMDKTREIGVLRALGASRMGIVSIFLGYALFVGVVGAALGLFVSAAVVWNLNEIQQWLTHKLGVSLLYIGIVLAVAVVAMGIGGLVGASRGKLGRWMVSSGLVAVAIASGAVFVVLTIWNELGPWLNEKIGFTMWDPEVYYFDRIPSRLDGVEVTTIVISAVAASVLGALVPAWLAGLTDPVTSLRYE